MPLVYARSETGWWCWDKAAGTKRAARAKFPDWITGDCVITGKNQEEIRLGEYFRKNCQPFSEDTVDKCHEKPFAIYYLVVQDQDYDKVDESFTNQSKIQIYIGSAQNGVKKRWSQHCCDARKVLKSKYSQNTIKENKHQLVDNFLALAWLRDFKMALFVVKYCENEPHMIDAKEEYKNMIAAEGECIDQHEATNIKHGLNVISPPTNKTVTEREPALDQLQTRQTSVSVTKQ